MIREVVAGELPRDAAKKVKKFLREGDITLWKELAELSGEDHPTVHAILKSVDENDLKRFLDLLKERKVSEEEGFLFSNFLKALFNRNPLLAERVPIDHELSPDLLSIITETKGFDHIMRDKERGKRVIDMLARKGDPELLAKYVRKFLEHHNDHDYVLERLFKLDPKLLSRVLDHLILLTREKEHLFSSGLSGELLERMKTLDPENYVRFIYILKRESEKAFEDVAEHVDKRKLVEAVLKDHSLAEYVFGIFHPEELAQDREELEKLRRIYTERYLTSI